MKYDVDGFADAVAAREAVSEVLEQDFDQSTRMSWVWALAFGPFYFAAHAFWVRAAVVAVLCLVLVGFVVAPFLAYPAWRARAAEDARRCFLPVRPRRVMG